MLPMCIVQACFLRESHPKSTSSSYFAHKLSLPPFIFSAKYRALFQVRWGSKKQVPCAVVSLGHRMQRFTARAGYPSPPWIFSANMSVTLWERLRQITLPQSRSLQGMGFSESSKFKRLCRATLCPSKVFWKNIAVQKKGVWIKYTQFIYL